MSKAFDELKKTVAEIARMRHIGATMYWDMATHMPRGGFPAHGDALSWANTEMIRLATTPAMEELLNTLSTPEEFEALNPTWQSIVRRMQKDLALYKNVPPQVLGAFVQARGEAHLLWQKAKLENNFALFAPHLEKMIKLMRKMAEYKQPGADVYDVMIDQYEEGMTSAEFDRLFAELKAGLVPLVDSILAQPKAEDPRFTRYTDLNLQREGQKLLLTYIGFDWNRGNVAETEHPFALPMSRNDVRVNNHFYAEAPLRGFFSAIHEGGHAIYEQNVSPEYEGTVAGRLENFGLHESQSRFYENILGKNKNFWLPIYPEVQKLMPTFADISLDDFYREINRVQNSPVRLDADEVTYCFHITIRYELEKAIFRDNVPVSELPALWNAKMKEYLHIEPANDAEGILQDMHWSEGNFGYFPSYLLGSIYDGMFLEALEAELGPVDELLAAGKIGDVTAWLNRNIHVHGSVRTPAETLAEVCKKPLSAEPLMNYFRKKYAALYEL